MSKGKTKTKTAETAQSTTNNTSTQTVAPNPTYAPQINAAAGAAGAGFDAATQNNAALMPQIGRVNAFNEEVMGGKYLNGNPHLQSMIDLSNRDIDTAVDSTFASAGRYGSGAHQEVLARAIAENEARLRYGNYATERGYQDAAGGKVLQGATISAAMPQMASSTYADIVNSLLGRYATQSGNSTDSRSGSSTGVTTGQGPGLLQSLLASGASAAGAYFGAR